MFLTRKIGGFLRGKATRGQVFLAALLGGLLGFVPGFFMPGDLATGFGQSPGLIYLLLLCVLVLNANLGVFAIATLLAKLCSMALLPFSFEVGAVLIDGPLQPLFAALVNAPITAWFGLEYYATTGGLVVGAFFGTGLGLLLVRALMMFRRRMVGIAESSERYQKNAGKTWVRLLAWMFFGKGKGKKLTYQQLLDEQRRALPIRVPGVVLVVLLTAGLVVFQGWFSKPLLTSNLRTGLTAANGATVDVAGADLLLTEGGIRIDGLALTDATDLSKNVFEAAGLEARIDVGQLLRRRFVIDQLRATDARTGTTRAQPGELHVSGEPEPEPPVEPGTKTIDDYLKDVETWKQRLAQVQEWIDWFGSGSAQPPAQETEQQREERVDHDVAEFGLARTAATHLRADVPLIWIKALDIEGIACAQLDGAMLDLRGRNLSSDAWLLPTPPQLEVATKDSDKFAFRFAGPSKDAKGAGLSFALRRVPIDSVLGMLSLAGDAPLQGGTLDLVSEGMITTHADSPSTIAFPLQVELRDTMFAAFGAKPTPVEKLLLPIGVDGPISRPAVHFDNDALVDALVASGKQELANFVQTQAAQLLQGVNIPAVPGIGEIIDPDKTPEQNLQDAQKKAEEAAKAAEAEAQRKLDEAKKKAEEEAKKKLQQGLRGLIPGRG